MLYILLIFQIYNFTINLKCERKKKFRTYKQHKGTCFNKHNLVETPYDWLTKHDSLKYLQRCLTKHDGRCKIHRLPMLADSSSGIYLRLIRVVIGCRTFNDAIDYNFFKPMSILNNL